MNTELYVVEKTYEAGEGTAWEQHRIYVGRVNYEASEWFLVDWSKAPRGYRLVKHTVHPGGGFETALLWQSGS